MDLRGLELEDIPEITARILEYTSSFPIVPRTLRDPTVAAANERQRQALLLALRPRTATWSEVDRAIAGAVLDVLWAPVSYERLVTDWRLGPKEAIRGLTWVINLVEEAIVEDRGPAARRRPPRARRS